MASRSSDSVSFEPRDEENQRLREENAKLRRVLAAHGIPVASAPAAMENKEERARKRIALFRSLFRGREDVYARRWENSDGRSGYSPAALKDWKAINSSRPEDRKKVDRNTRKFLPLSDVVIENHLLGQETIGIYPLLPNETCWFLPVYFVRQPCPHRRPPSSVFGSVGVSFYDSTDVYHSRGRNHSRCPTQWRSDRSSHQYCR